MKSNSKIYYGWYVVLATSLVTGAGVGLFNNCVGVFVKPVCDALGFSRGQFSIYSTITLLLSMFTMPIFAELYRKYSIKRVMSICAVVASAVPVLYSFSNRLWQFYAVAIIGGLVSNGMNMMMAGTLVNNWFRKNKSLATAIAFSGSGVLAAIMIPVTNQIIAVFGWQWGYRILAIMGLAILLPSILLVIRDRPEDMGLLPYGMNEDGLQSVKSQWTGFTREQAVRTPMFWFLSLSMLILGLMAGGIQQHTMPYLTDIGYSAELASFVISAVMISLTIGKISIGIIFDKFGTLYGSVFIFLTNLVTLLLLFVMKQQAVPYIFMCLAGFAYSGGSVPTSSYTAAYFGELEFARIYSLVSMANMLGYALGSPISGFIYDAYGSYIPAWCLYTAIIIVAGIMLISSHFLYKKVVQQNSI